MSWFMVGGAAIGAGVGSYGHDNWGWSKDAIWQGGIAGGVGGAMYGSSAGTGGAGAESGKAAAVTGGGAEWAPLTTNANTTLSTSIAGQSSGFAMPAIMSNPMLLGAAGMGLLAGGSGTGPAFQDKIKLSARGEALQSKWTSAVKGNVARTKTGDVAGRATSDIHTAKVGEGDRRRKSTGAISTGQAMVGNVGPDQRGYAAGGGNLVKASMADTGERMSGLFAPTSILNSYRKEDIMNAAKQIGNVQNLENQVGSFNYSSNLASWSANQMASSQRGAAIGSVAAMVGGVQRGQAQTDAYKRAMG